MTRKREVIWGNIAKNLAEFFAYGIGIGIVFSSAVLGTIRLIFPTEAVRASPPDEVALGIAGVSLGLLIWLETATLRPILTHNNKNDIC